MERIKSFEVDHTKIDKGMYISRIDDDIVTYDIRMVRPNTPPYLENDGLHTLEHLFATYARNSKWGKDVVYVGPMGCRTGFYLLTRKNVSYEEAICLVQESMAFIAAYEGDIPGTSAVECGNYLDHNLEKAKAYAKDMQRVLEGYTVPKLSYQRS